MRELVNAGLTILQLPFLLTDLAFPVGELDDQLRGQGAKLVGAKRGEIDGQIHDIESARHATHQEPKLFTCALASHHGNGVIACQRAPRQPRDQCP